MPNLLEWLEGYVTQCTSISDNWKSHHTTQEFFVEVAKRKDLFIRKTNFCVELNSYVEIPQELLTLTEDHKQQIREKFEFYTENFYPSTLWFLTKILADFEKSDDLNNPIVIAILKLREYVNELFKQHYPEEYNQTEQQLAKARKGHKQKAKIVCPECGSSHVVSSGINWVCSDCGRSFRKKLRSRKHYRK